MKINLRKLNEILELIEKNDGVKIENLCTETTLSFDTSHTYDFGVQLRYSAVPNNESFYVVIPPMTLNASSDASQKLLLNLEKANVVGQLLNRLIKQIKDGQF